MVLKRDFKEFIESLNENDVQYLVVGGYAVAYHGYPRYTKDMDVWIKPEPSNAEKVIEALEQFGMGSLGLTPDDFLEPGQIIQLGYPPYRIDILTGLIAVEFDECYATRKQDSFGDLVVNFIDVENLKKNKTATGRPQDLVDVSELDSE